jgi:hypothetical protein
VSAARAMLGLDAEIVELRVPLVLIAQMKNGSASEKAGTGRSMASERTN